MPKGVKRVKRQVAHSLRQARTSDERTAILDEIKAEIAENPTPKERTPGVIVGDSKVPWTYRDMVAKFPIVTFIPDETKLLTWNGVSVQCYNGIEMHVPEPFYALYRRTREEARKQFDGLRALGVDVQLGAGALT